jgi:hypothetical protein
VFDLGWLIVEIAVIQDTMEINLGYTEKVEAVRIGHVLDVAHHHMKFLLNAEVSIQLWHLAVGQSVLEALKCKELETALV